MKTIQQTIIIEASPHAVYEAYMDSRKHAKFTGDDAIIGRNVGDSFSAYGDYIEGVNLELEPDKKIVQTWRASDWPKAQFSEIKIELEKEGPNTKLVFTQSNIEDEFYNDIYEGWHNWYWNPLKEMLENN